MNSHNSNKASGIFLLALMITVCACLPSSAQNTINGTVTDQQTGEPVSHANIRIPKTQQGTLSDETGAFQITTDLEFPFKLEITHLGFSPRQIEAKKPDQHLAITLRATVTSIDQVVISASRRPEKVTEAPASISVINADKLRTDVVSHPVLSLRNLPGVEVQEQGIGFFQLTLRGRQGSFGAEALVLVDNRQLSLPGFINVPFGLSSVESIDLERIEVVRGPGSALYGPGVEGGVVHFLTKDPFQYPGTTIKAFGGEQASFGSAIRHAHRFNTKWGYKILATYKRANNWELSPEDSAFVGNFPTQIISALDGQALDLNTDINEVESMNVSGNLYFRPRAGTHLVATAGYGQFSGRAFGATNFIKYNRVPTVFGQLRLQADRFFSQLYLRRVANKEKGFFYGDGLSDYHDGTQLEAQAQYRWDQLAAQKLDITIGLDYEATFTDTRGTATGRFEDEDDHQIIGVYSQIEFRPAQQLEILAAGRADYFAALEQTTFSPRLALVFQPASGHHLRLTYNRSFGFFGASELFFDINTPLPGPFNINLWGTFMPITYSDPLHMRSYFGLGRSDQIGMPLDAAYRISLARLAPPLPGDVTSYLESLNNRVNGFSEGIMVLAGNTVTQLFTRDSPGRASHTNQIELGYKGLIGNKLLFGVDVYYNQRQDFFGPQRVNPVVSTPMLGKDLAAEVLRVIDPNELPSPFSPEQIASMFEVAGNSLGNSPIGVGVIEPDQAAATDKPTWVLAFVNFGKISYWGAEASLSYAFTPDFSAFANYSWLSDNFFDDEELNEAGTGLEYSLNQPRHRFRAGLDYLPSSGWHGNFAFRYGTAFEVVGGSYGGPVPDIAVLDAGIGYTFDFGLSADITANNLLNRRYRPLPPIPKVGRLVLGQLVYEF